LTDGRIRVALADDQTLVRQGIRSLLELTPDLRVVAEASDGAEALRVLAELAAAGTQVDVVLLDVRMPQKTGLEVLAALGRTASPPPCILLTTFDDDAVALEGIKLGARGFLLKDVSLEQLADAVRTVAAGGTMINPAVTARVVRGLARLASSIPASPVAATLTNRELDVLRLIASGRSNKEIADALGTAEATVKNQASSIFSKLGVRDRTRAVLRAIELGVL
jgi:DNA-binding NarL/FixJ family response regulator